jgi:hypothetical protein
MAIVINGTTGISGVNALSGVTTVSSSAANTPVVLQDSGSNSNTCRAWVNFNGTGTVAIRASFNVSSITDNGTGQYTLNFTNAMPDANYCAVANGGTVSNDGSIVNPDVYNTTSFGVVFRKGSAIFDYTFCNVSIFR